MGTMTVIDRWARPIQRDLCGRKAPYNIISLTVWSDAWHVVAPSQSHTSSNMYEMCLHFLIYSLDKTLLCLFLLYWFLGHCSKHIYDPNAHVKRADINKCHLDGTAAFKVMPFRPRHRTVCHPWKCLLHHPQSTRNNLRVVDYLLRYHVCGIYFALYTTHIKYALTFIIHTALSLVLFPCLLYSKR